MSKHVVTVSADSHPKALFKVNWSLLSKVRSEDEFAVEDKITQICSGLEASWSRSS